MTLPPIDDLVNFFKNNSFGDQVGLINLQELNNIVDIKTRFIVIDWLFRMGLGCGIKRIVIYRAILYFDKFASVKKIID